MNLRDLEYLAAIGELKHFRKAAEKCFVSQPTLSGQLKKLEDHIGAQLVERTTRNVFLTPIGEEIEKYHGEFWLMRLPLKIWFQPIQIQ